MKTYEELKAKQEIDLATKIEIFIKMLNKGNIKILKAGNTETLEGYPSIKLSRFWNSYQSKIKSILFEQEKDNPEFEIARQTILTKFNAYNYQELELKKQEKLHLRIYCFIKMLNQGNNAILTYGNNETLEGYPGIPVSSFWNSYQSEIKFILFEQEKDNPKFEIARQTILTKFNACNYQELEFKKQENLHLRITCFIQMLNEGNSQILKAGNTETFNGYPNTSTSNFWHIPKNREIIIQTLFDKLKDNSSFDTARGLILTNLKVDTIEEYYEKIEKESKKMKENNKIKKQLEETIKMVDEIYGLLNSDEEQRKRA